MVPRGHTSLLRFVRRSAQRNEYVAEAIWWSVFVCYAVSVAAISLGGVVGGGYLYFRYVLPTVAARVEPMAQAVVGLAYVFVLFVLLHSVVTRIRDWLYGGGTVAGWKQ
ncbi:hypothetical protein [Halobaculum roseum]|uniref:Uncharacterized protein n=1 Tax=Halobaculum roseum TaxID=2175149 RepID=A0ABD5MGX8_9EURY|nr:hypothetical protein [Halobaculum roseum]QZY02759.1 hypothetical protein K6T36_00725 [Halobaculum roseum]